MWAAGPLASIRYEAGRPLAWLVRLDSPAAQADASRARLSAEEVAAFSGAGDAPWRMLRRRLAKALVAQIAGCHPDAVDLVRHAHGALQIAYPHNWHISHGGQPPYALIGVHTAALGVDIEPCSAPPPPPDAFSLADCAALDTLNLADEATTLLAGWTIKEAHGKAVGRARLLEPREIALSVDATGLTARSTGGMTRCHLLIDENVVCAVAIAGTTAGSPSRAKPFALGGS